MLISIKNLLSDRVNEHFLSAFGSSVKQFLKNIKVFTGDTVQLNTMSLAYIPPFFILDIAEIGGFANAQRRQIHQYIVLVLFNYHNIQPSNFFSVNTEITGLATRRKLTLAAHAKSKS